VIDACLESMLRGKPSKIVFQQYRSKADKPSRAKIDLCPLWSKSGQTRVRLACPLSANCDQRTAAKISFDRAVTAPTFMALTCRWSSRPQHHKRTSAE
jgi:hypothetical protein